MSKNQTQRVYLDNNATTPLHPEVKKVMREALELYGNPSSLHTEGREVRAIIENVRAETAAFLGAKSEEIIFTGSGTEANNTILSMVATMPRKEIITCAIEHPAILEPAEHLKKQGCKVTILPVDKYGKVDLDALKKAISTETALVTIMYANNEIGTIQDIKTIAAIAHEHGALFHTDAIQAVGKVPINVVDEEIDFLTLSGHKLYGPKGIGALYIKQGVPFDAFMLGGHQELHRRAGTENSLAIIGLGKAIAMRALEMDAEHDKLLALKTALKQGIEKSIPEITFNGHPTDCLAGTLNVSFARAEGESVLLYLDLAGIAVSTGSACASGSLDPSHVLLATGLAVEYAHGSMRFSLGRENSMADVEYLLEKLPPIIKRIRDMSTL
ncbi:MAG: aminotransferase class V-fold PLP-dependent enzyme [Gammaproteobacteria bacterium]|nr:aminotransferase class V-fold PLP-dependent enzyme [Gammaproteobacteria bacterium]